MFVGHNVYIKFMNDQLILYLLLFDFSVCSFSSKCRDHVLDVWTMSDYVYVMASGAEKELNLLPHGINLKSRYIKSSCGCGGHELDTMSDQML